MSDAAPALAMVELSSVARGLRCLDALVKEAPVTVLEANLVEPGRYLILTCGGVAEVEMAHAVALATADEDLLDQMLLPDAHPGLLGGLRGDLDVRAADDLDCLGVVEGARVAATLRAADRSLKEAYVDLAGLRITGGLGGRAYYVVFGPQHDVEAALDAGAAQLGEHLHRVERIARPHEEMVAWLLRPAPFHLPPRGG